MILANFGNKKLLVLSISLELSAVFTLFFTEDFNGKVFAVIFPHLLASLTLSQVIWLVLPKKYKEPFPLSLISLFIIVFATPIVSYIALVILYIV